MFNLEKPLYALLQKEPFFAHFLLGCRIIFDNPKVQTAAVSIQRGEIIFYINSKFFFDHTLLAQTAILKHEVLHLLLEHCGARGAQAANKMAANIAMDCAINQHITGLPDGCVTLKSLEDLVKQPLKPLQSWEYYYEAIKEAAQKQQKGKGDGEPHDHDIMHDSDGDPGDDPTGEISKERRRMAVKDVADKATAAAAGNVPESLVGVLGSLNTVAKIPWKQQLRNFVSSARSTKNKSTRMRPNRRFELEHPGRKKIRELVLGVCTDSSGSVSNEAYAAFMTEISSIIKGTKITYLVHADCQVQKVDVIKDGKARAGVLTTRHGAGGTAYSPAIEKCQELGVDAIIYFGDMDSADTPKNPGVPFIWCVVGQQPPPAEFGRVLRLD